MNLQTLLDQLKRDEGLRLKPYTDTVGKLTIGYGRNLEDRGITQGEADYLLINDAQSVVLELAEQWPHWTTLDPVRQTVIANMAFNLGVAGLLKFRHTLMAVTIGDYQGAAHRMRQSKWYTQVKGRGERLARMMESGVLA